MHLKNLIPFIILFSSLSFAEPLTLQCKGAISKGGVIFGNNISETAKRQDSISFPIHIKNINNCEKKDCDDGWIDIVPKWNKKSPTMDKKRFKLRVSQIADDLITATYRSGIVTVLVSINRINGEAKLSGSAKAISASCGVDKVPERAF